MINGKFVIIIIKYICVVGLISNTIVVCPFPPLRIKVTDVPKSFREGLIRLFMDNRYYTVVCNGGFVNIKSDTFIIKSQLVIWKKSKVINFTPLRYSLKCY